MGSLRNAKWQQQQQEASEDTGRGRGVPIIVSAARKTDAKKNLMRRMCLRCSAHQ